MISELTISHSLQCIVMPPRLTHDERTWEVLSLMSYRTLPHHKINKYNKKDSIFSTIPKRINIVYIA